MPKNLVQKHSKPQRRDREAWRQLMAAYEASDQTQRAFCAEHGVAYSTFCYWRRRLRETGTADAGAPAPTLVELPMLSGSGGWRLELDLGDGIVLRLK
ncbi:MAG TPA: IS66 family insertion sequence element accessory protein TnpB [Guyparkeria sp.]|nr:IS66 family insertion sequence element accessory protein TnpB [Guyparkeria sp.]